MNNRLYNNQHIRELEKLAIDGGIAEYQLMLTAGEAAFSQLVAHYPNTKHIIVCAGKGNNAGDGFVVARLAKAHHVSVTVYSLAALDDLKGAALQAAQDAIKAGVDIEPFSPEKALHADVIVDALLGTGIQGEVKAPYDAVIQAMNASESPVVALDVPSGLDVDTGDILGCAVEAALTVTFIAGKPGLFTNKAPAYCGMVIVHDLHVPAECFANVACDAQLISWSNTQARLPKRRRDAYKGDHGHVLVIGGDYGMGGAVRMAAEAALRVGSGLVSVATRPEHVTVVNCSRPEIMCHQVAKADDIAPLIEKATVIAIGPGLGKSEWAQALLTEVLACDKPKVIDADALNLLADIRLQRNDWVLTPHPGEAARLLDTNSQTIQDERFQSATALQEQYGGVIVLKGAGTIVKAPNTVPSICIAGNPGMATGGMGDVLSGVIAGLIAQGLDFTHAATTGVMVHAKAADIAAESAGERGLLASDLMDHIRELVNP